MAEATFGERVRAMRIERNLSQEGWCAMEERDDGLGAARGCLYALPAGILAWVVIIWAVRAVLR